MTLDIKPTDPFTHEQSPPGPFRMDIVPIDPHCPRADIVPTQPNEPRCEIVPGDPNGQPALSEGLPPDPYVAADQYPPDPLAAEVLPPGPSKAA